MSRRRHHSQAKKTTGTPNQQLPSASAFTTQQQPSIFQQVLVWLFHFLLVTAPLFFAFTTDELFEFNKMMLTYVCTIFIGAFWIGRMVFEKRFIWRHTPFDYVIGFFLCSQLLSTIFSIHPYTSFLGYYSRFHGGLASSVSYAVLYWAFVSNVTCRDLRPLALSTMVAASLVSLYAIGEHFGHSVSCLINSGGTSFNDSCWVQDVQHRVFATFGQPNWLAAYVLMLLSVVVGILLNNWLNRWERFWYYSCFALLFWTLLYTRSRSGFLGFTVAMLVIAAGTAVRLFLQKKQSASVSILNQLQRPFWQVPSVQAFSIVAAILLTALVASGSPYSPSVGELLHRANAETAANAALNAAATPEPVVNRLDIGGTDSGDIRKIVWQGAFNVWKRYPLLGSGVETFAYSYYQDRPAAHNLVSEWDFLYNKAHNEFLNFLATTGVIGFVSYVLLLGSYGMVAFFGYIELINARSFDRAHIILGLAGAVAGLSVSNFFGFSTVVVTIFQYCAFAVTMVLVLEPQHQPKPVKELSLWQIAVLILIGIAALFPLKAVFDVYQADQLYTAGKVLMSQGDFKSAGIKLTRAIELNPREALFWDEISQLYAEAAASYTATEVPKETITQLAAEAVRTSNKALELNPRQLNLYKTRARVFILLSQVDGEYAKEAIKTLETATVLSPTDPKLLYNLSILQFEQGNAAAGTILLERAAELKPNYTTAILELAKREWDSNQKQIALDRLTALQAYDPHSEVLAATIASYSAELQAKKTK